MIAKSTLPPTLPIAELKSLRGELASCLLSIASLLRDEDNLDDALALRLAQYAACALGEYCPEVAFDPLAVRLRTVAERLHRLPAEAIASDLGPRPRADHAR
jgi:hypothetical protein